MLDFDKSNLFESGLFCVGRAKCVSSTLVTYTVIFNLVKRGARAMATVYTRATL